MKKLLAGLFALSLSACSYVESGNVGVKVYTLGGDKGEIEVLGMGRYWIGMNEELYLFPVFQQNYTWTKAPDDKDRPEPDESITFQTVEGMEVNADIGISYHLDKEKIGQIFQTYRRNVEEITDTFLRNHVRDALNAAGSKLPVESVYGSGKTELMVEVENTVKKQVEPVGIIVDKIYLIGSFRLPQQIIDALNNKMAATQRAQQRQNEVAEAKAAADKDIEKARGEAEAKTLLAESEAKANKTVASSISPELVQYEYVKKWNGVLPTTSLGSSTPVIFNSK
jgi:regulator of protease activity HflC (stomatin/prohibitin superfamily)